LEVLRLRNGGQGGIYTSSAKALFYGLFYVFLIIYTVKSTSKRYIYPDITYFF